MPSMVVMPRALSARDSLFMCITCHTQYTATAISSSCVPLCQQYTVTHLGALVAKCHVCGPSVWWNLR